MMPSAIVDYAIEKYIAPDGLMRLTVNDEREPFPGATLPTVAEENGILHTYRFYRLCKKVPLVSGEQKIRMYDVLGQAIESCRVPGQQALWHRHAGNTFRDNAHDNYIPPAAFDTLIARAICYYGTTTDFTFNNLVPGADNIRLKHQGGTVAFCHLCARFIPSILNFIWLLGGLVVNAFQPRDSKHNNPSTSLLAWDKIDAIHDHIHIQTPIYRVSFLAVSLFWEWKLKRKYPGGIRDVNAAYYRDSDHPINLIGEHVQWT